MRDAMQITREHKLTGGLRLAVLIAAAGLSTPALACEHAADGGDSNDAAICEEAQGTIILPASGPAIAPVDPESASQLVAAGGFSLSANAALATQYRFRGTNLSGDNIAVQGGVDVDHASGFYAGVWGSTINDRLTGYGGVELDIYGGYNWKLIEGVTADVGVVAYTFPDAPVGGRNFVELYTSLTATLGPASAKIGAAWDPAARGFAFAGFARDNIYVYSDLAVGIPLTGITLKGHLGYTDGTRQIATNSGTFDWSIGASYRILGPLVASVEYVDAAANVPFGPINPNAGNLVGKISVNF